MMRSTWVSSEPALAAIRRERRRVIAGTVAGILVSSVACLAVTFGFVGLIALISHH